MAKYEKMVEGNFDSILEELEGAILGGSVSASFEDGSDYDDGDFHCAVRVYERYSWTGGNRVTMTVMLVGADGRYLLSAITSGGSQGIFLKVNTVGEEAFLETIEEVAESF